MERQEKIPAAFSWSGGKDSALALYRVLRDDAYDVRALFTTFHGSNKRVSMHGIHESLVIEQAKSLGIPLVKAYLQDPTNIAYEKTMRTQFEKFYQKGITTILYGDIFLKDLRRYREQLVDGMGISCAFPLWGENTHQLMEEFLDLRFKTILCSLDAAKLPKRLAGALLTHAMVRSFPADVDPCGENGEYHSFCFDGPVFNQTVRYQTGKTVLKTYPAPDQTSQAMKFWFYEILPVD
jgi:uncharacterized protein (TIGR00290 family)